jgi:thiol-disulfide isomerase/thioredoxin
MQLKIFVVLLLLMTIGFAVGAGILRANRNAADPFTLSTTEKTPDVGGSGTETDEDGLIPANKARSAPEIAGDKWINSDPLTIENLRGRVVLIDFWTFGCYNCVNTLPTLRRFHEQYASKGLVIVGVETPETRYERVFENLVKAVDQRGIKYPVVTDYDNKTWDAYGINAWPTVVIVDKSGLVRYVHVGEGEYVTQESVIAKLLAEKEK